MLDASIPAHLPLLISHVRGNPVALSYAWRILEKPKPRTDVRLTVGFRIATGVENQWGEGLRRQP
jgi:hypothetical protein